MKIEHYVNSDELHVKLTGELDEHSSAYVRMSLDALLEKENIRRLYIDMSDLSFMDSTGIGVLIGRYKRLKPRGITVYIESPRPTVDRVLTLSGIYDIMFKAG
ncbi:MAG: anti-sigma factor antagonist [Clostridia bacterium]|nr:anti-sigma factor antagonist [Clostridia bacterium]